MWYDVTDLVAPDSNVAIQTAKIYPNFDGRIKLVTLVVAYNDGDTDTVHYWVNRGHDVDNYYYEGDYIGETSFSADLPEGSTVHSSNLTVVQMASQDGAYTYNGVSIPTDPSGSTTPPGVNWQGGFSGYNTWYASSLFNSNSDNTLTYDRTGAFYKIALAFLTANYTVPGEPDLTVEKSVEVGDDGKFIVSYTVKNIGEGPAEESTTCKYVNDQEMEREPCPALAPGQNVCADNDDVVGESNEDNNCVDNEVVCPPCPKPDLTVEKSVVFGDDGKFIVSYTVKNIGEGPAEESTTCKYVNDQEMEREPCPALAPGQNMPVRCSNKRNGMCR
jgi:hypothetical protein